MTPPEGAFHRAPRPLILWGGAILVFVAVIVLIGFGVFLFRVGNAVATAFEHAATTGASVPNMTGGIPELLGAIAGAISVLVGVIPIITRGQDHRYAERMDQQARGTAPNVPFVPPGPLPPSPDGPRPGDSA